MTSAKVRMRLSTCALCGRVLRTGTAVAETTAGFARVSPDTPGAVHLECAEAHAMERMVQNAELEARQRASLR